MSSPFSDPTDLLGILVPSEWQNLAEKDEVHFLKAMSKSVGIVSFEVLVIWIAELVIFYGKK